MSIFKISRRKLLIGTSGSVAIAGTAGLWLGINRINTLSYRNAVDRGIAFSPSAYLAIDQTGQVTIWVTRSEMGQGISTALPMLIADELDADWSSVIIEQAVTGPEYDYGNQFTAASSSVSGEWIMFRRAGATAKAMLIDAAADLWGVPSSECTTSKSVVSHSPTNVHASYADLAALAADQWAPIRPKLKKTSEFTLIGKSVPRLDLVDKVTGKAKYGVDVVLPDMMRAVIARPPSFGSLLEALDDQATRQCPGVHKVVSLTNGVAVVADSTYAAIKGRNVLKCTWQPPTNPTVSDDDINAALTDALNGPFITHVEHGNVAAEFKDGAVSADYRLPYLAHVCMEPMNCTAHVHNGRCEVWAPTQNPANARETAARITGLPVSSVRVHVTQLGGGFGRRASQDFVSETVELATKLDVPVQVMWTRDDDIRNASYREASAHRLSATLDPKTKLPTTWIHSIVSSQISARVVDQVPFGAIMGADNLPYRLDNMKVEWRSVSLPIPTTIWRSVGYSSNTFAIEAFISELADVADIDQLSYRLQLLNSNPSLKSCLERVAKLSNWNSSQRHLGLATYNFGDTSIAQVVEVAGTDLEDFTITHAWCVVDCGVTVNPDSVRAQIEGGIIDGLSSALYGNLHIAGNAIQQSNFHDYPLARINEMPRVDVEIIPNNRAPSGVGEAGLPGAAPALVSALFSLTGERIRTLPVRG